MGFREQFAGIEIQSLRYGIQVLYGWQREIIERVVQQVLEAEMTEHIGAAPYERSATRTGHRNGYKPRALRTRVGTLNLLVPQDREGTFSTRLFSRYQRGTRGRSV